jgi:hypothetical protein
MSVSDTGARPSRLGGVQSAEPAAHDYHAAWGIHHPLDAALIDGGFQFRTPGAKRGTRLAATSMALPLRGLRTRRALRCEDAESSEARNGHPVSPNQAGLNSLHERIQRPRSLRPS